jgi:Domain of unknown function (DUF1906)
MLPGQVVPAPPGLHGIDTNTVLNESHCRAAKARGFSFCLRYVSRGEREQAKDLQEQEVRTILKAGLALMPVQHVAGAGWSPTKSLGTTYGRNAAAHVRQIGWKSGSRVPDILHQMIQKIIRNDRIDGVEIDRNLTVNDSFGQSVLWLTSEQFNGEANFRPGVS